MTLFTRMSPPVTTFRSIFHTSSNARWTKGNAIAYRWEVPTNHSIVTFKVTFRAGNWVITDIAFVIAATQQEHRAKEEPDSTHRIYYLLAQPERGVSEWLQAISSYNLDA